MFLLRFKEPLSLDEGIATEPFFWIFPSLPLLYDFISIWFRLTLRGEYKFSYSLKWKSSDFVRELFTGNKDF